ncbi:MAG: alpha-amylase family glycosyl hydrolase [Deltaproteobacteria bacterium]
MTNTSRAAPPRYPALYQINTRVWLTELSRKLGRKVTLDDIPDAELDRLAAMGFDWIWMLSVWQTGLAGQKVSRSNPEWRHEFQETLPDLRDEDIGGSGFAITGYNVHQALSGDAALARLRERLKKRGLKLLLDFVPNHTGLDHPWVNDHPEYYIPGSELDLARAPKNYTWVKRPKGDLLLAYGRDPYFAGWPDTLQLNYGNPATQEAMIGVLEKIAGQCDGVRCDMAMLVLPDVFERTWGIRSEPFWAKATERVRRKVPGFCFMAEVYWDMEWTLQQQGFDYAYDKRLYDRLRDHHAKPVREHFLAGIDYQNKLARFLENHDEPRAAATFPPGIHEAAAVITFLSPGLRFFHQGQFEGRKKRISPHLCRAPDEPVDPALHQFYDRLLAVLRQPTLRDGQWQLVECAPAWDGNWTNDCFVAFAWQGPAGERLLAAVNYAPNRSQCRLRLPNSDLAGKAWRLQDQLGSASYDRDGNELQSMGLFLDLAPWQTHVFSLQAVPG